MNKPSKKKLSKAAKKSIKGKQESAATGTVEKSALLGRLHLMLFVFAVICAAIYVYLQSPRVPDMDVFYHLGHAAVYRDLGVLTSEFPWVTYSVISKFAADIWYGFHVLLIPFTFTDNAVAETKLAGIFFLSLLLVLFYWVLRRSQVSYSFVWPFMLLFIAGPFVGRLCTARPHLLTMGLAMLLFSFLISGSVWAVLCIGIAMSFVHLTFFWLAMLIAIVVSLVKLRTEKRFEWRKPLALLAGLTLGWLLRPNPMGALKVLNVQVFELAAARQNLVGFGSELDPVGKGAIPMLLPFILIWGGLLVISLYGLFSHGADLRTKDRTLLWSSIILSVLFFGMTVMLSKRSIDQWVPFGVIVAACGFTYFLDWRKVVPESILSRGAKISLSVVGLVIFAYMVITAANGHSRYMKGRWTIDPDRFRPAAEWLAANSQPDEIVFHARWFQFPELFYWNKKNRYIGGMDPIFQYSFDNKLYWKAQHLVTNRLPDKTWGTKATSDAEAEDTYIVLRDDFNASYVFAQKDDLPSFLAYLRNDPRYILEYENSNTAVFALVDANTATQDE